MQYSIVNRSKIDLDNRIDAEYFQPTYLDIEKQLIENKSIPLKKICSITGSAFYPAATHLYASGSIPFIRCVDCISYPVITKKQNIFFKKIPRDFAYKHKNIKKLKKRDIIVTKVGSPCYASIIHDLDEVALSRTVLGLKSIVNINPYYLLAFLRSKYGFLQLFRERELTIQYQLTLDRVGNILIFKPKNKRLEELISQSISLQIKTKNKGIELYKEAQSLLLSELNLADWKPKHRLAFIRRYSDIELAGRLDAEYFQPKYEEIINKIKAYKGGWDTLENLVQMKKGIEVGKKEYSEEGVPFIRVSDLKPEEVIRGKYISNQLYSQIKGHQPKTGEILLTKDASPGIAHYLIDDTEQMIISSGILRLQNKSNRINNICLTSILNSIITKEQMNRDASGFVILHWKPDQIKQTLIPILSKEKQIHIQNMVIESLTLYKKSKKLLEYSKHAVEKAIEQDEKSALAWLKDKLSKIPD